MYNLILVFFLVSILDGAESLVPSKKSKIDTNYSLSIICQKDLNKPVIKRPSLKTIKNVISLSNERSNYGDSSVNDFVKRVSNITPTEIFELQGFYHKHCYADFGNVEKRNRALLRYVNEVKYHLKCWSSCKQIAAKKESESIDNEKESYAQTVSDLEIVNLVQSGLNDPSLKILDMNMINEAYRDILLENGLKNYDIKSNYKRYLKELLLKNVANIKFVKNKNPSKPEIVCSEIAQGQAIDITVN